MGIQPYEHYIPTLNLSSTITDRHVFNELFILGKKVTPDPMPTHKAVVLWYSLPPKNLNRLWSEINWLHEIYRWTWINKIIRISEKLYQFNLTGLIQDQVIEENKVIWVAELFRGGLRLSPPRNSSATQITENKATLFSLYLCSYKQLMKRRFLFHLRLQLSLGPNIFHLGLLSGPMWHLGKILKHS